MVVGLVPVPRHGDHGGDLSQPSQHVIAADVPGMQDEVDACLEERPRHVGEELAVRVRDDTDAADLHHGELK